MKRRGLSGVFVHKFGLTGQLYLIAYLVDEDAREIALLALGGHEHFYRDLKQFLKS